MAGENTSKRIKPECQVVQRSLQCACFNERHVLVVTKRLVPINALLGTILPDRRLLGRKPKAGIRYSRVGLVLLNLPLGFQEDRTPTSHAGEQARQNADITAPRHR